MQRSPQDTAAYLLRDLDRWAFGPLLAQRAAWAVPRPQAIDVVVRDYRLAILQAVLKASGEGFAPLAAELQALRPLATEALAPYDRDLSAWEPALAGRFLDALEALAPFGESEAPLTRFAHGQYFKYSRRVSYLLQAPHALPCLFAPPSPEPV
jgi:hypothetical protein